MKFDKIFSTHFVPQSLSIPPNNIRKALVFWRPVAWNGLSRNFVHCHLTKLKLHQIWEWTCCLLCFLLSQHMNSYFFTLWNSSPQKWFSPRLVDSQEAEHTLYNYIIYIKIHRNKSCFLVKTSSQYILFQHTSKRYEKNVIASELLLMQPKF